MAKAVKRETLSVEDQELILKSLPQATALTRKLLVRTGLRLESHEIESAAYVALCEAALSYDRERGVSFLTYAWYFIQGEVREALTFRYGGKNPKVMSLSWVSDDEPESENIDVPVNGGQERFELRELIREAFAHLSPVALQVVLLVEVLGFTIVAAAEELGYSRPYLNTLHSEAIASIREELLKLEA